MKDKTLMTLMVETPNFIREKLLSDRELELFNDVKFQEEDGMTSSFLSLHWSVSVQHASTVLKKLYKKGYLKRTNQSAESGGDEYVYRVAI